MKLPEYITVSIPKLPVIKSLSEPLIKVSSPSVPVKLVEGVLDVSPIETEEVLPTWVDLDESEKSLILRVSLPSVVTSLASVWEKERDPSLPTFPEPVKAPEEKSSLVIPVPLKDQ